MLFIKNTLRELRVKIDLINYDILQLLNQRMRTVKEIAELKDNAGIEYFDPFREAEMVENIIKVDEGPLPNDMVGDIFKQIFKLSLQLIGIDREKRLLVSSKNDNVKFYSISEIFNISTEKPIVFASPCAVEVLGIFESVRSYKRRFT